MKQRPRRVDSQRSRLGGGCRLGVAIRCTMMAVRRLGVLEVACFYAFSVIRAAWTLGGGPDRPGAPGVAIRCTIMVFRRLGVRAVTCFLRILGQGVDTGGWSRSGGRPGGRNPLHYNGASSPRALEVTCFYAFSAIHAAWTLGGGADRGGAPGVAIRCTIMVFRRLGVLEVACF